MGFIARFKTKPDISKIQSQFLAFANLQPCLRRICIKTNDTFNVPYWQELPLSQLDITRHFKIVRVASPGTKAQLQEAIAERMATPFDFSIPLWESIMFTGLEDGVDILFSRCHHCIADGQGFIKALLTFVTSQEDSNADPKELQYFAGRVAEYIESIKPHPVILVVLVVIGRIAGILFLIYLKFARNRTMENKENVVKKQIGWSESCTLEDVKGIRKALGVTVNDVLMTTLTTAIEQYLEETPGSLKDDKLWVVCPTSVRHPLDDSVNK
jgi:diacylglycerol O-acyltransferase / wax synthase